MRIRLLAVGRLKAGLERDLADRYLERARGAGRAVGLLGFEEVEIPEARDAGAAARVRSESAALTSRAASGSARIVLDERGTVVGSEEFAGLIGRWRDEGVPETCFMLGGPDGHDPGLRREAELTLAFGAMTWPHQLVRVMLAEQLYRAVTILSGHPYHRA